VCSERMVWCAYDMVGSPWCGFDVFMDGADVRVGLDRSASPPGVTGWSLCHSGRWGCSWLRFSVMLCALFLGDVGDLLCINILHLVC
jgi:hypothetical protein